MKTHAAALPLAREENVFRSVLAWVLLIAVAGSPVLVTVALWVRLAIEYCRG
jgi:hypothetical protein